MGTPHSHYYAVSPHSPSLVPRPSVNAEGAHSVMLYYILQTLTAQSQLTVIQVPRNGEFALLGQYYCMSQV